MVLHFPDLSTLHAALATGMIPAEVAGSPVRVAAEGDGVVVQSGSFEPSIRLRGIGGTRREALSSDAEPFDCWVAIFPLIRSNLSEDATPAEVLFELPPDLFAEFATEMLRLGNDRQSCREIRRRDDPRMLLHVVNPPYYTLLRALDRLDDGVIAYRRAAADVWVQMGFEHPFAGTVAAEGTTVLIAAPRSWVRLDRRAFRDIYEVLDLRSPAAPTLLSPARLSDRVKVPLRLAAGDSTDFAELWVLRDDAVAAFDRFVRDADGRTLSRLLFAVSGDTVVVRARRSTERFAPPELHNAASFVRHRQVPTLFLPAGMRLHPSLRRDTVRTLLNPDDETVVWLTPNAEGGFKPASLRDDAFRPLHDWVEFVIDRERESVGAWIAEVECDFESFVGSGDVVESAPAKTAEKPRPPKPVEIPPPVVKQEAAPPEDIPFAEPVDSEPVAPLPRSDLSREREELENRFLNAEGPNESPERLALWPRLARVNAGLGDAPEAAICWAHAFWECDDLPREWLTEWRQSEAGEQSASLDAELTADLAKAEPTNGDLRRLSARVLEACAGSPVPQTLQKRLPEVRRYLEKHEGNLGVRVAWLTWRSLTSISGDPLGLARVRDRLLERLMRDGLKRQHDVPNFIHFAGQRDSDRLRRAQDVLWDFRGEVHEWLKRQERSEYLLHQSLATTAPYVDLIFAYGFARLGEERHRTELAAGGLAKLRQATDPISRFLADAFAFRIDQAIGGSESGPLPPAVLARLEGLDATLLYAVGRLRKQSLVLEPHERFDPYLHFKTQQGSTLGRDLVALQRIHDPKKLQVETRRILGGAGKPLGPDERLFTLAQLILLSVRGGREFAAELLAQVPPALSVTGKADSRALEGQARLIDAAVPVAANYEWAELLQQVLSRFVGNLRTLDEAAVIEPVNLATGQWLRALRRCGMGEQLHTLLNELTELLVRGRTPEALRRDYSRDSTRKIWVDMLRALLHVSEYWIHFGSVDRVLPYLEEARHFLFDGRAKDRPIATRYAPLVNAYVRAVGQMADLDQVVARYRELLLQMDAIPNTQTTNNYYSGLHLGIVESLVLSLVSDDFVLGETTRRWLDDDEYLVRRRIHADMRAALGE